MNQLDTEIDSTIKVVVKKLTAALLIISFLFSVLPVAYAENDIKVTVNGTAVHFDTPPISIQDRVMVPFRTILEAIGATVEWKEAIQSVTAVKDDTKVTFRVGDTLAEVNGVLTDMYGAAIVCSDRVMVSARFIGEAFGMFVDWDESENTIRINSERKIPDRGDSKKILSATANNDDGNEPKNVLDGNYYTRWSSDLYGAELTLTLAQQSVIRYIGLACYNGNERQTRIGIGVSQDGVSYTKVIENMLTATTLNMEAIDLGQDYNAKYVRIYCYGNTVSEWNSITEVKVYGPQEDGSFPVDENGPGGAAKITFADLPETVQSALGIAETYFDGVIPWLANLYDPESGGFYMTLSGKEDPNLSPALEMTSWGISAIRTYTDCFETMPESVHQKFLDFFNDRQDPKTGYFIDTQGPTNDRETARNQNAALGSIVTLKGKTRYMHPKNAMGAVATSTEGVLPDYLQSVDSYIRWVESWDWKNASWAAGDQVQQSQAYIAMLPEQQQKEYLDALFVWLEQNQNPVTGLWGGSINFNSVSGAFKNGLTYATWGKKLPNPEKIVDSVIKCYSLDKASSPYYIRNPLSVLSQLASYDPQLKVKIQQAVIDNIDLITAGIKEYLCPDGGYSASKGKSMISFGGVTGSHGLYEGDIDATLMILVARNVLYSIFDVAAPKLKSDDFWAWITGEKELPSPYRDPTVLNVQTSAIDIDFENFEINQSLQGDEFSGNKAAEKLQTKIVYDRDKRNNKILSLYYDGSLSDGPGFLFADTVPAVKYVATKKTVAEFNIKVKQNTSSANFFIQFGGAPSYALSFGGSGAQNIGVRIASDAISYGGRLCSLEENEWYQVHLEYELSEDNTEAKTKIYIDGELVSTNSYYYGFHIGATPVTMDKSMQLYYYRAGTGYVYLDNIHIYTE